MSEIEITVKRYTVNRIFAKCPECGSIEIKWIAKVGYDWNYRCLSCKHYFKSDRRYPYLDEESLKEVEVSP